MQIAGMSPKSKARKLSSDTQVLVEERSLVDLPDLVLSAIAKHGFGSEDEPQTGHPLLAVARSLRDAVLGSLTKIRLDLQPQLDSRCQPEGRLLHRACCQAAPGLDVELDLGNNQHALSTLLQPALDIGGWHNVHGFTVALPGAELLNLLGTAMPALRHVSVSTAGDLCGLFTGLLLCKHLTALDLLVDISPAAVKPTAAALAQLPALRDVSLQTCGSNPANLVEQLTCLTALKLEVYEEVCGEVDSNFALDAMAAAARNPALRVFSFSSMAYFEPAAADVQHFLEACPSLSDLDLQSATLSPDVVEVLLTHGTSITSLSAESLDTDVSLADRPCSWKCLKGLSDLNPTVLTLANLPLGGLTSLEFSYANWGSPLDLATLQLPMDSRDVEDMLRLLRQAAINIAACPAWSAAPPDHITLEGDPGAAQYEDQSAVMFSAQQRIQLLESLTPLGGPHVTEFVCNIWNTCVRWGRPEVQALAHSLRSDRVTTLALDYCYLPEDFWAALDEFMPELETLQLGEDVTYTDLDIGRKFVIFCARSF